MKNLIIKNLEVSVGGKKILKGINLKVKPGEIHIIMGPNGSGKSTLAGALMGYPKYQITNGEMRLNGRNIKNMSPDKRAKLGLFLSMQHTPEIAGVTVSNFLRLAYNSLHKIKKNPLQFYQELLVKMKELGIDSSFAARHLNVGFSGGEKKRMEILQLAVLSPQYAILDETDSGLDVDALKAVGQEIHNFHNANNAVIIITHHKNILKYIKTDFVHLLVGGKIIKSGKKDLAEKIEKFGFKKFE